MLHMSYFIVLMSLNYKIVKIKKDESNLVNEWVGVSKRLVSTIYTVFVRTFLNLCILTITAAN